MTLKTLLLTSAFAATLAVAGCEDGNQPIVDRAESAVQDAGEALEGAADEVADAAGDAGQKLAEVSGDALDAASARAELEAALLAQPDEVKARYQYRHPSQTVRFFDVKPGETVIEALPGGGWYSKILLDYLGPEGKLIGADYSVEMWPLFGGFATEEFVDGKRNWVETWTEQAAGWGVEDSAAIAAYQMGTMPDSLNGTVDTVLFVRALHNLTRFEDEGGFRTQSLNEAFRALKPGGIAGVVQHRAPEAASEEWADGSNGYVKTSEMVAAFEAAGFELVDSSEINANPKDEPSTDDIVWRLPPNLSTSGEDADKRAEMQAIGESDRMTLKFRKPA